MNHVISELNVRKIWRRNSVGKMMKDNGLFFSILNLSSNTAKGHHIK